MTFWSKTGYFDDTIWVTLDFQMVKSGLEWGTIYVCDLEKEENLKHMLCNIHYFNANASGYTFCALLLSETQQKHLHKLSFTCSSLSVQLENPQLVSQHVHCSFLNNNASSLKNERKLYRTP